MKGRFSPIADCTRRAKFVAGNTGLMLSGIPLPGGPALTMPRTPIYELEIFISHRYGMPLHVIRQSGLMLRPDPQPAALRGAQ